MTDSVRGDGLREKVRSEHRGRKGGARRLTWEKGGSWEEARAALGLTVTHTTPRSPVPSQPLWQKQDSQMAAKVSGKVGRAPLPAVTLK